MSVLEKIRSKSGLLIGFVGGALVLFILQSALSSSGSLFASNANVIGKINGKNVEALELKDKVDEILKSYTDNDQPVDENLRQNIIEQAWTDLVNERVLKAQWKTLGIEVSDEELNDLLLVHPHQFVISSFTDRQSGKIYPDFADSMGNLNIKVLNKYVAEGKLNKGNFWNQLKKQVRDIRTNEKYFSLIKKGFYTTENEAKINYADDKRTVTAKYVFKPYSSVADSTMKVTDEELKKYYDDHIYLYNYDETTRKMEYIVWEAVPSQSDIEGIMKSMETIASDFKGKTTGSEDSSFIANSNENQDLDIARLTKQMINPNIDSSIYNAPIGTVFGPYMDNNMVKVSKLMKVGASLDSAKVRHLLIAYAGSGAAQEITRTKEQAKKMADSLTAVIKKGGKFDELVKTYSDDGGKKMPPGKKENEDWMGKNGNYGWMNEQSGFVEPFKRFGLDGKKGDIGVVETQFGYHIMEILDVSKGSQKMYTLGTISQKIEPSKTTIDEYYAKASTFAGQNNTGELFDKAVDTEKLNKRVKDDIKEGDKTIPGLDNPKELIRWLYKAQLNEVSPEPYTFGNRFVVAKLAEIKEKGPKPLESVKEEVTIKVKQEKKAEQFLAEFASKGAGAKTPEEYASKLGLEVKTAENIGFNSYTIPNTGRDDDFMGVIAATKAGAVSKPFKGQLGVFVVKVETESLEAPKDYKEAKKSGNLAIGGRAEYEGYDAMKKMANIEDHKAQRDF